MNQTVELEEEEDAKCEKWLSGKTWTDRSLPEVDIIRLNTVSCCTRSMRLEQFF